MLELGRASHRVAHTVCPVGSSKFTDSKSEVVAIIAILDNVHYHAIVMGLIKAGLVPFPMSPRNSAAGIVSMLRPTNCHRILATRSTVYALLDSVKIELQQSQNDAGIGRQNIRVVNRRTTKIVGRSGLHATSFRIGQVVHPSWAMSDWFPILLKSGIQMSSLPTTTGLVTWIPVQTVSNATVDNMFLRQHYRSEMLHLVHPRPILWNEVIELVCTVINDQRPECRLALVSAAEWPKELEELGQNEEMIRTSPAISY